MDPGRGYLDPSYPFCGCHEVSLSCHTPQNGSSHDRRLWNLCPLWVYWPCAVTAAKATHTRSLLTSPGRELWRAQARSSAPRVSSKGLGTKPCMTPGIICLLWTMAQNSIIKLGRSLPSSEVCWRTKFGNDCKVLGTMITHSQFSGKLDDGNKQLSLSSGKNVLFVWVAWGRHWVNG